MIVSRTPFRISFFGGGTDYPAWYRRHGGAVLATTIDKYCYLTCRHLPPFFEHKYRVVYSNIDTCQTIDEIRHPAARAVIRYLGIQRGLEIHHDGDLPARSGMGSSSAFTVGLLHALHVLQARTPDKHQLATESVHIEQEMLKETVGSQDQVMAAYGGLNHVLFRTDGEVTIQPVTLPPSRLADLNDHLMLFYTGIKRTASDVADSFVKDIDARERQLEALGALVDAGLAILKSGDDLAGFGQLLHEAWAVKRNLSSAVTNPEVNEIYHQAREAGALGGKLTGAGGGGFMLLFVPPGRQASVRQRLHRLLQVPFTCEFNGSQIIFSDPGEDYAQAESARDRQAIGPFRELADLKASGWKGQHE
jgi:D-glycero-alpha-D-manno-heptose-7-phosphate kinase